MARELLAVKYILDRLVADEESEDLREAFKNEMVTNSFVVFGVAEAGTKIRKNFLSITDAYDKRLDGIDCKPMTNREIILASRCAYRTLALSVHHTFSKKAINFSTNSFSVRGMTERPKEIMRIVWWCDTQINDLVKDILNNPEDENGEFLAGASGGNVVEMQIINDTVSY